MMKEERYHVCTELECGLSIETYARILESFSLLHDLLILSEYGQEALKESLTKKVTSLQELRTLIHDDLRPLVTNIEGGSFLFSLLSKAKEFGPFLKKIYDLFRPAHESVKVKPSAETGPEIEITGPRRTLESLDIKGDIKNVFQTIVRREETKSDQDEIRRKLEEIDDIAKIVIRNAKEFQDKFNVPGPVAAEFAQRLITITGIAGVETYDARIKSIIQRQLRG